LAIKEVTKMGNPILRGSIDLVTQDEIKSGEIASLLQDMQETMAQEQGIGIAAPQIGVNKQVAIIGIPEENPRYPEAPEYKLIAVINPKIKVLDETLQGFWEGCLSVPGLRGYVERPRKIEVSYLDLKGEARTIVAEDFIATVFQHEIDHLNGILYVDRITDKTRFCFQEEFDKYWTQAPVDTE
jgi:peptide deformylase